VKTKIKFVFLIFCNVYLSIVCMLIAIMILFENFQFLYICTMQLSCTQCQRLVSCGTHWHCVPKDCHAVAHSAACVPNCGTHWHCVPKDCHAVAHSAACVPNCGTHWHTSWASATRLQQPYAATLRHTILFDIKCSLIRKKRKEQI